MKALRALASEVVALQKQARTLGMFADDRELLACAKCGMHEEVTFSGFLITVRPATLDEDTGLRFKELAGGRYRCPVCGATVRDEDELVPVKTKIEKRKRSCRNEKNPELTFQKHIADYRPQIARHEQLGLNFAEVRAVLFAGKEMGEDAIGVLGETLRLHHAICGAPAAEREIVTATNRWAPAGRSVSSLRRSRTSTRRINSPISPGSSAGRTQRQRR